MSSGGGTIWALGVCKEELQCELKDQHMDSLSSVVFILAVVYTPSIPLKRPDSPNSSPLYNPKYNPL